MYVKIYTYNLRVKNNVLIEDTNVSNRRTDALSRNIIVIVTSNIICWIPVTIVAILSLVDVEVHPVVMTTTAVVTMVVNSICNPIIYTFATANFKTWLSVKLGMRRWSKIGLSLSVGTTENDQS